MQHGELLKNAGNIIEYLNRNINLMQSKEIKELSNFIKKVLSVTEEIVNNFSQCSNDNICHTAQMISSVDELIKASNNLMNKYHIENN